MNPRHPSPVSVVVLNYNSRHTLAECLASVLRLDWPGVEVIVVDNASTDGSADMVVDQFPTVRLIRRAVNSPTAGRNEGFRAAAGEYVLSLDNDIVVKDPSVLQKGVELFRRFPKAGLLAFKIGSVENPGEPLPEHWWHRPPLGTWKDTFFYTDYFPEGAVFFRAAALRATGGYDEEFFWGFESVDLSLRLIREGFELLYCPVLACGELRIRGSQTSKRLFINYLSLRNRLWIAWKHYPLWRGLWYAGGRIGVACLRSLRYGWADHFIRGVRDGIAAPASIRGRRRPMERQFWRRIEGIRTCRPWVMPKDDSLKDSLGSGLQVAFGAHEGSE